MMNPPEFGAVEWTRPTTSTKQVRCSALNYNSITHLVYNKKLEPVNKNIGKEMRKCLEI